jgi:hypothetical protein
LKGKVAAPNACHKITSRIRPGWRKTECERRQVFAERIERKDIDRGRRKAAQLTNAACTHAHDVPDDHVGWGSVQLPTKIVNLAGGGIEEHRFGHGDHSAAADARAGNVAATSSSSKSVAADQRTGVAPSSANRSQ